MKIVLLSDSHGNKDGIDKLFSSVDFDYLFFMGDGLNDFGCYLDMENVYAVSGNCDFFSRLDNEKYVELGGKKIFFTHGNKYGVKLNLDKLITRAKEIGVDLVFYGHTHNQRVDLIDGIYFINPGKFFPNSSKESCGLILNIDGDKVTTNELKIV